MTEPTVINNNLVLRSETIREIPKQNEITPKIFLSIPEDTVTISSNYLKPNNDILSSQVNLFTIQTNKQKDIHPITGTSSNMVATKLFTSNKAEGTTPNKFDNSIDQFIFLLDKNSLINSELDDLETLSILIFEQWGRLPLLKQGNILNFLSKKNTSQFHLIQFIKKLSHILSGILDTPILKESQVCDIFISHLPKLISDTYNSNEYIQDSLELIRFHANSNNLTELINSLSLLSDKLSNRAKNNVESITSTVVGIEKCSEKKSVYEKLDSSLIKTGIFSKEQKIPSFKQSIEIINKDFGNQLVIMRTNLKNLITLFTSLFKNFKNIETKPKIKNEKTYLAYTLILKSHLTKIDRYFYLSLLFYNRQENLATQILDNVRDETIKKFYCIS